MKSPKDRMIFSGVCLHLYFALFLLILLYNLDDLNVCSFRHNVASYGFVNFFRVALSRAFLTPYLAAPDTLPATFFFFFAGYESWNKSS